MILGNYTWPLRSVISGWQPANAQHVYSSARSCMISFMAALYLTGGDTCRLIANSDGVLLQRCTLMRAGGLPWLFECELQQARYHRAVGTASLGGLKHVVC
jgi:hypothetical protein